MLSRTLRTLSLSLAAMAMAAAAQAADINTTFLGTAIEGYDPVAYFTDGKPVEGSDKYEYEWGDATWRFASAEHRDMFAADPDKYAPAYGGYCAYGVAKGKKPSIDPDAWRIVDGKLYLNYSLDVQTRWEKDIPGFIAKADENWPNLRDE